MRRPPSIIIPSVTVLRIATVLAFAASCLSAQTRIASVDSGRAFVAYHKTDTAMQEIARKRVEINEDPRLDQLRDLATATKEAEAAALKLRGGDEKDLLDARRRFELKREELRASARAIKEDREAATRELDRRFVEASRKLLTEVRKATEELGSERGFDLVIDSSGNTNTGLPLLLYAKDLPDLTEAVIARLNADAPPPGLETEQGKIAKPGKKGDGKPRQKDGSKEPPPIAGDDS